MVRALPEETTHEASLPCHRTDGVPGIKPTVGLIGRDRITPIAADQDTAGPHVMNNACAPNRANGWRLPYGLPTLSLGSGGVLDGGTR